MSNDDDPRDTPPTGIAIPRPRRPLPPLPESAYAPAATDLELRAEPKESDAVKLPDNPTLRDLYALIDARVPPDIKVRLSSIPPKQEGQERAQESKPSMPVRAAKATGRWSKGVMAIIGGIMTLLQGVAWYEENRGPIEQAVVIAGKALGLWEAYRLRDEPELAPEPVSPMLPEAVP